MEHLNRNTVIRGLITFHSGSSRYFFSEPLTASEPSSIQLHFCHKFHNFLWHIVRQSKTPQISGPHALVSLLASCYSSLLLINLDCVATRVNRWLAHFLNLVLQIIKSLVSQNPTILVFSSLLELTPCPPCTLWKTLGCCLTYPLKSLCMKRKILSFINQVVCKSVS